MICPIRIANDVFSRVRKMIRPIRSHRGVWVSRQNSRLLLQLAAPLRTHSTSKVLLKGFFPLKRWKTLRKWSGIVSFVSLSRGGSRGRVQGVRTPPPEMTCGFLINTVQSASQLYKICFIIWYVFSAVHIMLLPSRKPSSSYSLLKFVYVTSQLRHSLVVHPLLRKILDPPLLSIKKTVENRRNNSGKGKTEREVSFCCAFCRSYFALHLSLILYWNRPFYLNSLIFNCALRTNS